MLGIENFVKSPWHVVAIKRLFFHKYRDDRFKIVHGSDLHNKWTAPTLGCHQRSAGTFTSQEGVGRNWTGRHDGVKQARK